MRQLGQLGQHTKTWAHRAGYALSVLALAGTTGCEAPSAQAEIPAGNVDAVAAYVGQLETMAQVLADVVDDHSARAAAPRIREIAREMGRIRGEMGQVLAGDRDGVVTLYGPRLAAASDRLRVETHRIGLKPGLVREVQDALAAVPPLG